MRRLILFFLMLASINIGTSFSQEITGYYDILDFIDYINRNDAHLNTKKPYVDIAGSPYMNETFTDGQVAMEGNIIYKGKLRYNIYADEMEFMMDNVVYWFDNAERINLLTIGEQTFVYTFVGDKFNKGDFYKILESGKCQLLVKSKVILMPAVPAKPYQDPKPARFERKLDIYYLKFEGQDPEKISNKKDLMRMLKDQAEKVSVFMKENHTSGKDPADLKKLIEFYNSL